jgi:nucleoid-associated protein
MRIQEANIHELKKPAETSGQGCVAIHSRPSALPVDQTLTTLCADLLTLYTNCANSNGTLGQDQTIHTFPVKLNQYHLGNLAFQQFTLDTLALIAKEMQDAFFANGGYALFLRYQHDNSDFVLVAMLKLKAGAGIDEATLTLQPTLNIDLTLLHEAARINLTRLANSVEPYLSFIKGRSRTGKVTDYFRKALSCENFTNSNHHTEQVMKAADAYVDSRTDLTTPVEKSTEKADMRKRVCDCFAANAEEVVLQTLAAAVHPTAPQYFLDFVRTGPQSDQYQINESFKPDKSTFARWRRLRGTMGSVTVSFDVADVTEHRVTYDPDNDTLVLKSPPKKLVTEIKQYDNALTASGPT